MLACGCKATGPNYISLSCPIDNRRVYTTNRTLLIQWLAGYFDGNGRVKIHLKDTRIIISANNAFIDQLAWLVKSLGIDCKTHRPKGLIRTSHLEITSPEAVKLFLTLVNGHIRHPKKTSCFILALRAFDIKYIEPVPIDASNAWFAGFIDGGSTIKSVTKPLAPSRIYIYIRNIDISILTLFESTFKGWISPSNDLNSPNIEFYHLLSETSLLYNYILKTPLLSHHYNRFALIPHISHFKSHPNDALFDYGTLEYHWDNWLYPINLSYKH